MIPDRFIFDSCLIFFQCQRSERSPLCGAGRKLLDLTSTLWMRRSSRSGLVFLRALSSARWDSMEVVVRESSGCSQIQTAYLALGFRTNRPGSPVGQSKYTAAVSYCEKIGSDYAFPVHVVCFLFGIIAVFITLLAWFKLQLLKLLVCRSWICRCGKLRPLVLHLSLVITFCLIHSAQRSVH